jgi:hypothetical protein
MSSKILKTIDKVLADDRSDERDVRAATASHQRDLPYDREEEAQVTRREFCNFLGLTSAALFVGAAGFAGKAAFDTHNTNQFLASKIEGAASLAPARRQTSITVDWGCGHSHFTPDGSFLQPGQKCTHLHKSVYFERCTSVSSVLVTMERPMRRRGMFCGGPPPDRLTRLN